MKRDERLLLVSEDDILNKTRALILADWNCVTANPREAPALLTDSKFEVMILGHSIAFKTMEHLINLAHSKQLTLKILALRFPCESKPAGVETHFVIPGENPGWIRDRVAEMLCLQPVDK